MRTLEKCIAASGPPREPRQEDTIGRVARTNAAATGVIVAKVGDPPGNI